MSFPSKGSNYEIIFYDIKRSLKIRSHQFFFKNVKNSTFCQKDQIEQIQF